MAKFTPLTRKVNAIIIISIAVGVGLMTAFFANWLLQNIDVSTQNNLRQQSEILYKTIENFMLPGDAPRAEGYFRDINAINPDYTIRVYRTNGNPAFQDNFTLANVNNRLGRNQFPLRTTGSAATEQPKPPNFTPAVTLPPEDVFFKEESSGLQFFRMYKPLINLPKCTRCHGSEHTIRGVVDIRNNITASVLEQSRTFIYAIVGFLFLLLVLTLILTLYMRTGIINPVKVIGNVCAEVAMGKFDRRVNIKNRDEIGILGKTVNTMVEGLHERFKLSKFVSGSTIRSLSESEKGRKEKLTVFFSDVRQFTSYSEAMPPEIVVEHLNQLLSMQTEIIHGEKGDVDKYVGDEVLAIFSGDEGPVCACRAAVRIQRELSRIAPDSQGLQVGIGINFGEVILGMIGSDKRADYTVIGDAVNTASRFCNAAKAGQSIISESVHSLAGSFIQAKGPFRIKVKGKAQDLKVYLLEDIIAGGTL